MKKFIVPVVMLCAVLISSMASAAANWVWVYSDDEITIYVDNNSIRRDRNYSGYVFRAFTKWYYSDSGRNSEIEWYRSNGIPLPKGIYNLSHSIHLSYYKIENGMKYRSTMNTVYYDRNGSPILGTEYSTDTFHWELILPDTIGETIFDNVRARVPN